jgi:hypothetical protein
MSDDPVIINIAELAMELPFRNTAHGQALTAEIVRRFRQMPQLPIPKASATIPNLRVDLAPLSNHATDEEIAEAVVAGIHQALSREIASVSEGAETPEIPGRPAQGPTSAAAPATPAATAPPATSGPGRPDSGARLLAMVGRPDPDDVRLSATRARELGIAAGRAAFEAARRAGHGAAPDPSVADPLGLEVPTPKVSTETETTTHVPKPGASGYVSVVGTFKDLQDLHNPQTSSGHGKTVPGIGRAVERTHVSGGRVAIGLQLQLQTLQTTYFKGDSRDTPHEKDGTLGHHEDRHKAFARHFFTNSNVRAIVEKEKLALVVEGDEEDQQALAIYLYLVALEDYESERAVDPADVRVLLPPKFSGVRR